MALPPLSEDQSLSIRLAYAIESTKDTGFTLDLAGKHLAQLPIRMGQSKALDSATACFLSAHDKLLCPTRVTEQHQHRLYSQALRDMKEVVEEEAGPAETVDFESIVAAMMVLGDFEVRVLAPGP